MNQALLRRIHATAGDRTIPTTTNKIMRLQQATRLPFFCRKRQDPETSHFGPSPGRNLAISSLLSVSGDL